MDFMHWARPQPSTSGEGQTPVDPRYPMQGNEGGFGGRQQQYADFLSSNYGYTGGTTPGSIFQFAQGLRQDGHHPRWEMNHPGQEWPGGGGQGWQGGGGLGGLLGNHSGQDWQGFQGQWGVPEPRPMNPGGVQPQGVAYGEPNPNRSYGTGYGTGGPGAPMMGLAGLARTMPIRRQRNP